MCGALTCMRRIGDEGAMALKHTAVSPHSLRVLVADDYAHWRSALRSILQSKTEWKIVFEACNGLEAVQKTVELNPDVILLDICMPGLNGIEAARIIRQRSPNCRIVFVTANRDPEIMDVAIRAGASGYVFKANAAHELLEAIATALRHL